MNAASALPARNKYLGFKTLCERDREVTSASDKAASSPSPPSPTSESSLPPGRDDLARTFRASKSALRDLARLSATLLWFALQRLVALFRRLATALGVHLIANTKRMRARLSDADFASLRARLKSNRPAGPKRQMSLLPTLLLAALAIPLVFILYLLGSLPVGGGISADNQGAMTFEAANGDLFAARGVLKGQQLAADEIPEHLRQAIIAIEDRRFYDHHGIDVRGLFRAAWRNTTAGGIREGGSTITQQLARLLYLSPERSFRRKFQEVLLALWLESKLTKGRNPEQVSQHGLFRRRRLRN